MKHTRKTFLSWGLLCLLLFSSAAGVQAKTLVLKSPDGQLKVEINVDKEITYSVSLGNDRILAPSPVSMDLKGEKLGVNPKLVSQKYMTVDESESRLVPFKNAVVENHCEALLLKFKNNYSIEFRAYNDAVAYRFITDKKKEIEVIDEQVALNFPDNYKAYLSQCKSFKTSYEEPYTIVETSAYKPEDMMTHLPVLFETGKGYKILFSEADLFDYPGIFLKGTGENGMTSVIPKCPLEFGNDGDRSVKITKEADYIAKTIGKRSFPWRFLFIAKQDGDLLTNDMVYKLTRPCAIKNPEWIRPGQVVWDYWHGNRIYGVDFKAGINTDTYKYYIDFAAQNGVPYIILDEGWSKTTLDPFHFNPAVDIPELVRYGKEKDVKLILWLTWLCVENNPDLFKTFHEWGIGGVKIDFMDRTDQWMVNYYERVAKEAAKYNILVDFHGAFKPAGLEKAYPNLLTYEGVLGMEYNIYESKCDTKNSIYLPFIRNAVGPMDYTPGAMMNMHPEDHRPTRTNSVSIGTRAYQMALYVIFESGLQMLSDNPVYYNREKECTNFITKVPVTWDETKVLKAELGKVVVLARRKGDKWFIGGMTNENPCDVTIDLGFLQKDKKYTMTSFEDGVNASVQAMDYKKRVSEVGQSTTVNIHMVRDGGWAAVIE